MNGLCTFEDVVTASASFPRADMDARADNERVEKILGMEFVTLYFNECSQIKYATVQLCAIVLRK